jgi:putative ABC transport system permease protein
VNFWRSAQSRIAAIPGVDSATAMGGLPPQRPIQANDTQIENFTPVPGGPGHNIDYWQVAGDRFFETLGVHLIDGRLLDSRDAQSGAPTVVINQTMARTYYGNESAVGRRIRPGFQDPWRTVVGVVEDVKNGGLDQPARTEIFLPYQQGTFVGRTIYFAVHTAGDPASLISSVRAAIREVDPALPLSQVKTMDDVLSAARSRPRFLTTLLGMFSATALILAAIGLYGVISYSVTRRTSEFGVRMAIGAQTGDVLALVMRQAMRLSAAGVVAGALGGLALTRFMRGLLYQVSAFDPLTFAAMAGLLFLVAACACIIPAMRATKVDPIVALRYE